MANEQNLRPIKKGQFSHEQAVSFGKKGAAVRAEKHKRAKSLREGLQALLDGTYGIDGEKISGYDALCIAMFDPYKVLKDKLTDIGRNTNLSVE